MNYHAALRLLAARAVEENHAEYNLRYIYRWYSKTFHTPLHQVDDLDPEDVLQAFYETTYEEMSESERAAEKAELLETPEEALEKRRAKDIERAEMYEFARITAEEERIKAEKKKLADLDAKAEKKSSFEKLVGPDDPPKPTILKDLKELPPNIEMKFVDTATFEEELEGFGSMMPKKA